MSSGTPGSPVGGDGVETVADSAADGRTPLSAGVGSFNGGEALRGDREALIGIAREALLPEFLAAGYRLLSVDDDTVERVAEALRRVDRDQRYDQLAEVFGPDATGCGGAGHPEPCGGCIDCHSAMVANDLYSDSYCAFVQSMARAAVQALREAGTDA